MVLHRTARRVLGGAAVAVMLAAAVPLAVGATGGPDAAPYNAPRLVHSGDAAAIAAGRPARPVVFGGLTSQKWPVVVQIAPNGKKVVSAVAGVDASNGEYMLFVADGFRNLAVKRGRFHATWGPMNVDFGGGHTADVSGSITGRFFAKRRRVNGTWTYRAVVKNAAGTVVTTHDTRSINWSARQ